MDHWEVHPKGQQWLRTRVDYWTKYDGPEGVEEDWQKIRSNIDKRSWRASITRAYNARWPDFDWRKYTERQNKSGMKNVLNVSVVPLPVVPGS